MSAVLITGATTPIGHAIVTRLVDGERTVLAVGAEASWPYEPHPGIHYLRADLTRSRDIRQLLFGPAKELSVDALVHAALHRSTRDRGAHIHRLNVESTRELLHLAQRHPTIERFVYRSFSEVYRVSAEQAMLISEEHPLELGPTMPQRVRDRVEADMVVCTAMGMAPLHIVVLRCAEVFCPDSGSQLHDYLSSELCLRPLGFDPMINVLSPADAARAVELALDTSSQGVFNVPGRDVLPLSRAIELARRKGLAIPGPALGPLYALRTLLTGREFDYELNRYRFHFSGVLDGRRAREVLGFEPRTPVDWRS